MIGVLVRDNDNRVVAILEGSNSNIIDASTPSGQTFHENVTVDKSRMRYAYYDGSTVTYTKTQSEIDADTAWIELRRDRDALLLSSDFTQTPDGPLTDAKKAEWATYRQALRDLPSNTTDPANPTWPSKPT
jgi:hypothetical protein